MALSQGTLEKAGLWCMEISASSQKPVELLAGTLLVLSYMIIFPFRALDEFWARADLDQTHK